jgi:hypothetical protein
MGGEFASCGRVFFHHPNRVAYCWAHSPLWSCVSIVAEAFTSQIVAIFWLEREPSIVIPEGRIFPWCCVCLWAVAAFPLVLQFGGQILQVELLPSGYDYCWQRA